MIFGLHKKNVADRIEKGWLIDDDGTGTGESGERRKSKEKKKERNSSERGEKDRVKGWD